MLKIITRIHDSRERPPFAHGSETERELRAADAAAQRHDAFGIHAVTGTGPALSAVTGPRHCGPARPMRARAHARPANRRRLGPLPTMRQQRVHLRVLLR